MRCGVVVLVVVLVALGGLGVPSAGAEDRPPTEFTLTFPDAKLVVNLEQPGSTQLSAMLVPRDPGNAEKDFHGIVKPWRAWEVRRVGPQDHLYDVAMHGLYDEFWRVNLSRREVYLVQNGSFGQVGPRDLSRLDGLRFLSEQRRGSAVVAFSVGLADLALTYEPSSGKLRLRGGGLTISEESKWHVARVRHPWLYDLRQKADGRWDTNHWTSWFVRVNTDARQALLLYDSDNFGSIDASPYRRKLAVVVTTKGAGSAPEPTAGSVPRLLTPAAGAVLDNGRYDGRDTIVWDFRWSPVRGATAYHLYVERQGATRPVVQARVDQTWYRHEVRGYMAGPNLQGWTWKVRALIADRPQPWSPARAFVLEAPDTDALPGAPAPGPRPPTLPEGDGRLPPPLQPEIPRVAPPSLPPEIPRVPPVVPPPSTALRLLEPAPNAVLDNGRRDGRDGVRWTFTWAPVAGAQSYEILVQRQGAATPLISGSVPGTTWLHTSQGFIADANRGGWTWKVRGIGPSGPLPWSQVRRFSVEPEDSDPP